MKRLALGLVVGSLLAAGCGDDDDGDGAGSADAAVNADAGVDQPDAAPLPDAAPDVDAQLFELQPAVGVDTLALVGTNPTFAALGGFLNGMVRDEIENGGLVIALELRELDDPSGQADDDAVELGFYVCGDPDGDASDNFNPEMPDRWVAQASSLDGSGNPRLLFGTGSVTGGVLTAAAEGSLTLPGLPLALPITDPTVTGALVAAPDQTSVYFLDQIAGGEAVTPATLTGTLLKADLADASIGIPLPGCGSLLDIISLGCEITFPVEFTIVGSQPDLDLDEDGREALCDTCSDEACAAPGVTGVEPDAMQETPDSSISCCRDGDGTIIAGQECWKDERMADAYRIVLRVHGTRVQLASPQMPPGRGG